MVVLLELALTLSGCCSVWNATHAAQHRWIGLSREKEAARGTSKKFIVCWKVFNNLEDGHFKSEYVLNGNIVVTGGVGVINQKGSIKFNLI